MIEKVNPTKITAWKRLGKHFEQIKLVHMKDLFALDKNRFDKFSIEFDDIFLDYSKNIITDETIDLLLDLAGEINLKDAITALFNGQKINETEDRAVLHTALRSTTEDPILVDGKKLDIPSYRVKPGQKIEIKEASKTNNQVVRAIELTNQTGLAPWVDIDAEKIFGIFTRLPEREEVVIPVEERLIVELYSK